MGHEFAHVDAWASGDIPRYVAGDQPTSATGPAMQTGRSIYAARPTLTKEEAAAIVDTALGIKK